MLSLNEIGALFKHIFKTPNYGESLEQYIVSRKPQTPQDIERLERQWSSNNYRRGDWL